MDTIPTELIEAYLRTDFKVFEPPISIRIGQCSKELELLLELSGCSEWAFITPYNPASAVLSDSENMQLLSSLKDKVAHLIVYEGEGVGEDPLWKPERSLLIIGIRRNDAVELGQLFGQNAIVVGQRDTKAELVILV